MDDIDGCQASGKEDGKVSRPSWTYLTNDRRLPRWSGRACVNACPDSSAWWLAPEDDWLFATLDLR